MDDAKYQRGWREGWAKGTAMEAIRIKSPMDTYNRGLEDGFNAGLRGEANRYPVVTNIIFFDSREEAETALDRIRAHPEYDNPERWSIDDTGCPERPRFVVNYNWDLDDDTRFRWFQFAICE